MRRCGWPMILVTMAAVAQADVAFEKVVIDPAYKAEACVAADMNNDGRLDIVAGENWYEATDWRPHKFRPMAMEGGYADVRCDYAVDCNGDGWIDIATVRRASSIEWLENPGQQGGDWKVHKIGDSAMTKGVIFADVDGDGRGDFVGAVGEGGQSVAWWKQGEDACAPWRKIVVGEQGGDLHGLGVGDIDRDGHNDIVTRFGWYESPDDPVEGRWQWHKLDRGITHHLVVYDFDGDGDNDIAAGAPHDYGLYWWAQSKDDAGNIQWKQYTIDKTISQLNSTIGADIDGDGDLDLVTGKRYKAHHGKDPGTDEPAMLVWYELIRDGREARFVRHDIDDDSGIGYTVRAVDLDGDGDTDIISANQKGVFLFVRKGASTWADIFNGKNLDNWKNAHDKKNWRVEGDTIVGETKGGLDYNDYLVTAGRYADFVLTCRVRLVPDSANSGIQFRSEVLPGDELAGYQADIGQGWWGGIYDEHGRGLLHDGYQAGGRAAVQPGQWNDYVLYAVGDELRVEINGTVCTHLKDGARDSGIIALQIHSGGPTEVRFRDLKVRKVSGQ